MKTYMSGFTETCATEQGKLIMAAFEVK